jgi:lipid II:glycine glycyltransferase (peptidoglycan interpeptide bridge formation enzyme)
MALTIDSFDTSGYCPATDPVPAAQNLRAEFHLDLRPSVDGLWAGLAGTRRTQIRRAQRAGLVLKLAQSRADVDQVTQLVAGSANRWAERHGKPFETPGPEKLDRIVRHLVERELAAVYLAERGGKPVSGNLIYIWNYKAYNFLAGSVPDGFEVGAASWLYWEIIKDLKSRDVRNFNLGGTGPSRGLADFKRDFGGRLVDCASPTYILWPKRYGWWQSLRGLRGRAASLLRTSDGGTGQSRDSPILAK